MVPLGELIEQKTLIIDTSDAKHIKILQRRVSLKQTEIVLEEELKKND